MPIRHSAWRRTNQFVSRRLESVRLSTDRKTICLLRDRSERRAVKRAFGCGSHAAHHHAQLFGTISSSRCQRTCRRTICDRCWQDGFHGRKRPGWWSQTGSNRRPPACKAGALPTELWPHFKRDALEARRLKKWWAWEDLNFRPHAYQARALTN
jgi:hypothetical protein